MILLEMEEFIDLFIVFCLVAFFKSFYHNYKKSIIETDPPIIETDTSFSNDFYEKIKAPVKINKLKRLRRKINPSNILFIKTTRSGKIYNRL